MLQRDQQTRVISGVCGGIGRYLALDAFWIRLAFILLAMTSGVGLLLYLVLALVIPPQDAGKLSFGERLSVNIEDLVSTIGDLFGRVTSAIRQSPTAAVLFIGIGIYFLGVQFGFWRFPIGGVLLVIALIWIIYLVFSKRGES